MDYDQGPPPTRCAECGQVLSDALVLSCGHDLCLSCAAGALRQTRSFNGRTVRCYLCNSTTELHEEAAHALSTAPAGRGSDAGSTNGRLQPTTQRFLGAPSPVPRIQAPAAQPSATASSNGLLRPVAHSDALAASYSPRAASPRALSSAARACGSYGAAFREDPRPLELNGAAHTPRCSEHPDEPATYFCATCECQCICAECVVQKDGRHREHEVLRVSRAHEALRARAGALIDEAVSLEDDLAMVADRLAWRRKDVERAAARGRASVRGAFARVRAQLNDREAELLESLDVYESESLGKLDRGTSDHTLRLQELRRLQESLRSRCRTGGDAVEALNTYAAAKRAIASLRDSFRQEDLGAQSVPPDEFVGLAGSARAELDLHAEGLMSLEEAVASLCERGLPQFQAKNGRHPVVEELPASPSRLLLAGEKRRLASQPMGRSELRGAPGSFTSAKFETGGGDSRILSRPRPAGLA